MLVFLSPLASSGIVFEAMDDKEKVRKRNENKASKTKESSEKGKEKDVDVLHNSCHGKQGKGNSKSDGKPRSSRGDTGKNTIECPAPSKIKWERIIKEMGTRKLAELTEAFHLFDFDRDGIISFSDLKKVYVSLDKGEIDDEQIKQMISEGVSPLDFDAFVKLMGFKTLDLDEEDVLIEALSQWDYGTGLISEEKIRHDLMTWGDQFTEEEANAALENAPIIVTENKEKMIDYVQFSNDLCGFLRAKNFLKGK